MIKGELSNLTAMMNQDSHLTDQQDQKIEVNCNLLHDYQEDKQKHNNNYIIPYNESREAFKFLNIINKMKRD